MVKHVDYLPVEELLTAIFSSSSSSLAAAPASIDSLTRG
jgi:hypothetical protein